MNDHDQDSSAPIYEARNGSFEVAVTTELLQQACDCYRAIHGTQQLRIRYRALHRIVDRRRNVSTSAIISLVVFLNVATLTVSIVFFRQGDTTGGYVWGTLFLLLLLSLLSIVFNRQVIRWLVALQKRRLRTEAGITQRSAEKMFESYKAETPYTVTYQLGEDTWSSDSEPGGHKEVELNSDLFVLHNRSSYLVYESEFSYHAEFVIAPQTDAQRSLVETNLAANGIPCHHVDEFDLDLDSFLQ